MCWKVLVTSWRLVLRWLTRKLYNFWSLGCALLLRSLKLKRLRFLILRILTNKKVFESEVTQWVCNIGGLAHMVERPLSMREAPGSIPGSSTLFYFKNLKIKLSLSFWSCHRSSRFHCISFGSTFFSQLSLQLFFTPARILLLSLFLGGSKFFSSCDFLLCSYSSQSDFFEVTLPSFPLNSSTFAISKYSATLVTKVFLTATGHMIAACYPFDPEVAVRTLFEFRALYICKEFLLVLIANTFLFLVFLACLICMVLHSAV